MIGTLTVWESEVLKAESRAVFSCLEKKDFGKWEACHGYGDSMTFSLPVSDIALNEERVLLEELDLMISKHLADLMINNVVTYLNYGYVHNKAVTYTLKIIHMEKLSFETITLLKLLGCSDIDYKTINLRIDDLIERTRLYQQRKATARKNLAKALGISEKVLATQLTYKNINDWLDITKTEAYQEFRQYE